MLLIFAVLVLVTVPVYWGLVPRRARRATFGVVSLVALGLYAPVAVGALGALTVGVHVLAVWSPALAALLALGVLALHKLAVVRLLGVSYVVFRLVHLAIEVGRGRAQLAGPAATLEYALHPPAFLSGPIERWTAFRECHDDSGLDLDTLVAALARILAGLVKKIFLVAPLAAQVDPAFAAGGARDAWLALAGYALIVYLDFSAYCDMALGVARLYGFRLTENFDWPYLAGNITEFWQRWHITLSTWLRDYVFLPVSIAAGRLPVLRDAPVLTGACAALVTMLACGLWHGDTAAFLLWGLGHGLASATHQVWRQKVLGRLPARRRKALLANPAYRALATLVTFLTVSLLWPLFRLDVAGAVVFWRRLVGVP